MANIKRGFLIEKEKIERFCQSTEEVLKKIRDRVNEEQTEKQQKKKKTTVLTASE